MLFGIFIKKVSVCLMGGCQIFQSYIFRLIATQCMLVEAMSTEKSTLAFVFQLFRFVLNTLIISSWNSEIFFFEG